MRTSRFGKNQARPTIPTCSDLHMVRPGNLPGVWTAALTWLIAANVSAQPVLYVDAQAPGPQHDGSTWCTAYTALQDALAEAVASGGAVTEIHVADGTYRPDQGTDQTSGDREATFQLLNGVALRGGYAGCRAPDPDGRNIELNETVLSGDLDGNDEPDFQNNDENAYHVVTGSATDATAILDGFTITAGNADGDGLANTRGGGMYNDDAHCTVSNCTFAGNSATAGGGGMYNGDNVHSSSEVVNCKFIGNSAGAGGGMANFTNLSVVGCTFTGNSATKGGGMFNRRSPSVIRCAFNGNSAARGGGMWNVEHSSVIDCTFNENSADEDGGGMFNRYDNRATVRGCEFFGNAAGYAGGAMYNGHNSIPTVYDCTFSANTAFSGAGMYNGDESNPQVNNCIFSTNTADHGAGMYNSGYTDPQISDCTFDGNSDEAIYNGRSSNTTMSNCTFTGNSGSAVYNGYYSNATVTDCVFSNNTGSFAGAMHNGNYSSPIVTNCAFSNNTGSFGGAMHNGGNSNPTVDHCMFTGNSGWCGGAISSDRTSNAVVAHCIFIGNSARHAGGALCNYSSSSPTVSNCLFNANSAEAHGGAIYNGRFSYPDVTNCTFTGNFAGTDGGAIHSDTDGHSTVTGCILWGDTPDEIHQALKPGAVSYSCVEGGVSGPGYGNISVAPAFVDADGPDDIPGTLDDNLRLSFRSPCIDAGDNDAVPLEIAIDLDGKPRFVDVPEIPDSGNGTPPIVDMGAFELQGVVTAHVDIGPGTCPNRINVWAERLLPVAVIGSASFDVREIVPETIILTRADGIGGTVQPVIRGRRHEPRVADVATPFDGVLCGCHRLHGDGIDDLVTAFSVRQMSAALDLQEARRGESVMLTVSGFLSDGTAFQASDCVGVIGRK